MSREYSLVDPKGNRLVPDPPIYVRPQLEPYMWDAGWRIDYREVNSWQRDRAREIPKSGDLSTSGGTR